MSSTIPKLLLQDGTSNAEFQIYFNELEASISKTTTVHNHELRVFDVKKEDGNNTVKDKDYLKFVTLAYKECEVSALFNAETNYLLGFLSKEFGSADECRPRGRRICYIIVQNTQESENQIKQIKNCVKFNFTSEYISFIYTELGEAYTDLEEIARLKRIKIPLGRRALIDAIIFLSTTEADYLLKNLDTMAKHVIVLTQMFCESFRLKELAAYRLDKFEAGFTPPEYLVVKEHGWAAACRRLQAGAAHKSKHQVYFADLREGALTEEQLLGMYGLLMLCDKDSIKSKTKDFDKVMTIRYLYSWFKQYVKSRPVKFESTNTVTAMVHLFEEYLVLQYNHLQFEQARVDVEAFPSNSLTKIEIETQPLQSIPGRTFVAFKRIDDGASRVTFSSTWHMKVIDADTEENLPVLNVLELLPKDYVKSMGLEKFYEKREIFKSTAGIRCIHFRHRAICKNLSLEKATEALQGVFGVKLGHDKVNPYVIKKQRLRGTKPPDEWKVNPNRASKENEGLKPDKYVKLVHGVYLDKFEVFAKFKFKIAAQKVVETELQVACDEDIHDAILEILQDWEAVNCNCNQQPAQEGTSTD